MNETRITRRLVLLSFLLFQITSTCLGIHHSRELATLAEKWNITGPVNFTYDRLEFSLTYEVSDFILDGMIAEQAYDEDCAEGGKIVGNGSLVTEVIPDTSVIAGNGDGVREIQVNVTIDPTLIAQSPLYSEESIDNQMIATVRFCHRFMLYTLSETPIEVNFRETLVTLTIDLTDGFAIGALNVRDKDKLIQTANQAYEVEGYQCDYSNEPLSELDLALSRNQGSIIRVCVRPNDEARNNGIFMRSIDSFVFERNYGGSIGMVSQVAIENKEPADNLLTILYCEPGDRICVFETILMATFFRLPGSVEGSGLASMQFGDGKSRRLRGERFMQEEDGAVAGQAVFDLSLELLPRQKKPSSGTSMPSTLMSMIFGVGMLLMLVR